MKFGSPQIAELVAGNGGLPKLHIHGPSAEGDVYLHGAHLASWKPAGHQEVLWLSGQSLWTNDKPIRGGVPICFPWFGPKKDLPEGPVHGFARLRQWNLDSVAAEGDSVKAVLALNNTDAATRTLFPAEFELRFEVSFGAKLVMRLELTNTGSSQLNAEEALHTYFSVGDVRDIEVKGLEGERFLDKVDGAKEKTQEGTIRITAETDRVYMNAVRAVEISDPKMSRRLRITKENSLDTVVWNPWVAKSKAMPDFGDDEWPGMICVETCNVMKNAIRLEPGQRHVMAAEIEILSL